MRTFADLVTSRKAWIENDLRPWCRAAALKDLRLAELEWGDIAGKVDPEKTLWFWAWSRFPDLVSAELSGIDETHLVAVTLRDGRTLTGYPDARKSRQGKLTLLCRAPTPSQPRRTEEQGPFPLDEITAVIRSQ